MSTSAESNVEFKRAYVPTTALAKSLAFDEDMMHVTLIDGLVLGVPLQWFPALRNASREQLDRYEIAGAGSVSTGPNLTKTYRSPDSWQGQTGDRCRMEDAAHVVG